MASKRSKFDLSLYITNYGHLDLTRDSPMLFLNKIRQLERHADEIRFLSIELSLLTIEAAHHLTRFLRQTFTLIKLDIWNSGQSCGSFKKSASPRAWTDLLLTAAAQNPHHALLCAVSHVMPSRAILHTFLQATYPSLIHLSLAGHATNIEGSLTTEQGNTSFICAVEHFQSLLQTLHGIDDVLGVEIKGCGQSFFEMSSFLHYLVSPLACSIRKLEFGGLLEHYQLAETKADLSPIITAMSENHSMTSLHLESGSLRGQRHCMAGRPWNTALKELMLKDFHFFEQAELALDHLRGLERLSITDCDLRSPQAVPSLSLERLLSNNIWTLRAVDISWNLVSSAEWLGYLPSFLARSTELRSLVLAYDSLGEAGTRSIACALRKNTTLRSLSLVGGPEMDEATFVELVEALKANQGLKEVTLIACQLQRRQFQQIVDLFEANHQLLVLELGYQISSRQQKTINMYQTLNRTVDRLLLVGSHVEARDLVHALITLADEDCNESLDCIYHLVSKHPSILPTVLPLSTTDSVES